MVRQLLIGGDDDPPSYAEVMASRPPPSYASVVKAAQPISYSQVPNFYENQNANYNKLYSDNESLKQQAKSLEDQLKQERSNRYLDNLQGYAIVPRLSYNSLYDWSLGLLPSYYDYSTRSLLRDALSRLINREISLHSSKAIIEDKVRKLIQDTEDGIALNNNAENLVEKKTTKKKKPKSRTKRVAKSAKKIRNKSAKKNKKE